MGGQPVASGRLPDSRRRVGFRQRLRRTSRAAERRVIPNRIRTTCRMVAGCTGTYAVLTVAATLWRTAPARAPGADQVSSGFVQLARSFPGSDRQDRRGGAREVVEVLPVGTMAFYRVEFQNGDPSLMPQKRLRPVDRKES